MLTTGDRDPLLPPAVQAAHDAAVQQGRFTYRDPRNNGLVVTRLRLEEQGHCCGLGCRHCPWPAAAQRGSGRPLVRGEPVAPELQLERVHDALAGGGLGFRAAVWEATRCIPRGKVLNYGGLAALLGRPRAARQVGYALAALRPEDAHGPEAVPWWRVLRKDGSIALQGSPERGERQAALLREDGVAVLDHRVDMSEVAWRPAPTG